MFQWFFENCKDFLTSLYIDLIWQELDMSQLPYNDADDRIIGYKIEVESPPGMDLSPSHTTQRPSGHGTTTPD